MKGGVHERSDKFRATIVIINCQGILDH